MDKKGLFNTKNLFLEEFKMNEKTTKKATTRKCACIFHKGTAKRGSNA
jgi:hypothetical protein